MRFYSDDLPEAISMDALLISVDSEATLDMKNPKT